MKTLSLVVLSVILSVTASPLGDRAVFRRHKGVPLSRRHILQSRTDAPAACAALAPPPPSNTTTAPDLSSTDLPSVDPTTTDNSTDTTDPSLASNTTVADPTAIDNSTDTTNSTATRRFWARHGSSFGSEFDGSSFDSSFSSSHVVSVSVSFEESISTFVQTWEDLCLESGGDIFTNDPCINLAGDFGFDALSEHADACDQLDIADSMITFAKSRGIRNKDALINHALSFRAHPRNSVEVLGVIPSSLYCLRAPVNPELVGIYNQQIEGVNPGLFGSPTVPMVPFGSSGTCPLGMTADVSTCGCTGGDSTDSTDDSTDSTDSTDDSTDSTDDSTDPTDVTATDSADLTAPTDATATDSADASDATDASSTDTADVAAATDATATTSAVDANVTPTDTITGPNFQPTDISGNVNDPNGRR